jgi:hypothetical protein
MPEIHVRGLVANLPKLMEYRATTSEEDQESDDYDMIMQLHSSGRLPDFPTVVRCVCACVRVRELT